MVPKSGTKKRGFQLWGHLAAPPLCCYQTCLMQTMIYAKAQHSPWRLQHADIVQYIFTASKETSNESIPAGFLE